MIDHDRRMREKDAAAGRLTVVPPPKAAKGDPGRDKAKSAACRWQTFNSFVDVIAPRLTPAERWVWVTMFRHTRNGVCETTERQIAEAANVSRSTVEAALKRLRVAKLVWPIWLSRDKSKPSKYGLNSCPSDCRERLVEDDEPPRPSGRSAK